MLDFMVDLPSGGQAPVAATQREVAALWNIFSAAGRRVGVVGWWATWPAENVRGTIVSDRVAPQLIRVGATLDERALFPPSETERLATAVVRAGQVTYEDVASYVPLTRSEYQAARTALETEGSRFYRNRLAHLATIIASTRSHAAIAEAILDATQPDLLMIYVEEIDSVSHLFIRDPRRGPPAIERAYRDADDLIARLAARSAPDTLIIVCSDHGFYPADAAIAEDPADLAGPATAWHRPYGIVAAAEARSLTGESVERDAGRTVGTVTPLDIAPTVLHAAGLPISLEMPGRVAIGLLPEEQAARPVSRVPTLEPPRRSREPSVALSADPDARERLQALGYLGTATTSLARLNLGEILYRRGNLAGAERELRAVVEAQPQNLAALLWLAKTVRDQGRPQSALALYERALALPGDTSDVLVEAVDLAASSGLAEDARRIAASPPAAARAGPAASVARAIVAQMDGRPVAAEQELRAALRADPTCFSALSRLLDALIAAHRPGEAVPPLSRATDRVPASARHQALLGAALLAAGDARGAEARLTRALGLAPDGTAVLIDLSRARLAQGKVDAAVATLADAPPSVERSLLMGAAYSRKESWAEAASHYRTALDKGSPTPDLLNGLAWAQIKLGQTTEAVQLLNRSLALDKNQPEISRLLAEIGRAGGR